MTETQRQIYCNGHHDRMRGIQRQEAPVTLRKYWLDGWDSADGELCDISIQVSRAKAEIATWPKGKRETIQLEGTGKP